MRILTKQLLQNHPGWRKSIFEIRRPQVGVSGGSQYVKSPDERLLHVFSECETVLTYEQ